MTQISSICVYCGSRTGVGDGYRKLAQAFGRGLAERGIVLTYGGGRVGLMGVVADAVLAAGGRVVGIIPRHLHALEVGHDAVGELIVVDDMHTRKRMMFERSDGFVALPGGFGTLDETVEIMTWRQLRLHDRPIVLLDHEGYWQPLLRLFEHFVARDFAGASTRQLYEVVPTVDAAFETLLRAPPPVVPDRPERI